MKNLHLLPTENYKQDYTTQSGEVLEVVRLGQLIKNSETDELLINKNSHWSASCDTDVLIPHHVYITNEEEIKVGDWFLDRVSHTIHNAILAAGTFNTRKKIILTTDQNLINEGVKPINDDFLEWFVNNPSCDEVDVLSQEIYLGRRRWDKRYSIFPPKKKYTKQENKLFLELSKTEAEGLYNCIVQTSASGTFLDIGEPIEKKLRDFLNKTK